MVEGWAASAFAPPNEKGRADAAAVAPPNRELWPGAEEKEKLGGAPVPPPPDANGPRAALSSFWPKLNVTPAGTGAAPAGLLPLSAAPSRPKENKDAGVFSGAPAAGEEKEGNAAAAADEEEEEEEGEASAEEEEEEEEEEAGSTPPACFSPPGALPWEPPSVAAAAVAPYFLSMLARCCS